MLHAHRIGMCCDTVTSLLGAPSKDILLSRCHKIWAECFLHVCNSPVGKEEDPEDVSYRLRTSLSLTIFFSSRAHHSSPKCDTLALSYSGVNIPFKTEYLSFLPKLDSVFYFMCFSIMHRLFSKDFLAIRMTH